MALERRQLQSEYGDILMGVVHEINRKGGINFLYTESEQILVDQMKLAKEQIAKSNKTQEQQHQQAASSLLLIAGKDTMNSSTHDSEEKSEVTHSNGRRLFSLNYSSRFFRPEQASVVENEDRRTLQIRLQKELIFSHTQHLASTCITYINAQRNSVKEFFISLAKQLSLLPFDTDLIYNMCFDELFKKLHEELSYQCYKFRCYNKLKQFCYDTDGGLDDLESHVAFHKSWHEAQELGIYPVTEEEDLENTRLAEEANKATLDQYEIAVTKYKETLVNVIEEVKEGN